MCIVRGGSDMKLDLDCTDARAGKHFGQFKIEVTHNEVNDGLHAANIKSDLDQYKHDVKL